jgi:hypothetical protein
MTPLPPFPSPAPSGVPRLGHGLVFALHRDPRGAAAMGRGGAELGYGGLEPSFGVRFDTYGINASTSTLGFLTGGVVTNDVGEYASPWAAGWGAAPGYVVSFSYYAASKRVVTVVTPATDDDASAAAATKAVYTLDVDLPLMLGCPPNADTPCDAHVGFTAATGTAAEGFNTHRVLDFQYLNAAPTPTPSLTPSASTSATLSASWSMTAEPTSSNTGTGTWTASITGSTTLSSSLTASGTASRSATPSATPTQSGTRSSTRTASQSPTALPSPFTDVDSALAAAEAYTLALQGTGGAYDWHNDPLLVSLAGAPDSDHSSDRGSVSLAWEPFEDVASGVSAVAYCLGTAQYECDVVDWTLAPGVKAHVDYATLGGVDVPPGTAVYATVAAVNNVGLVSMSSSDGLLLDGRPPALGHVVDTGRYFLHPQAVAGSGTVVYRPPVDINCDAEGGGVGAAWGADTSVPSGLDHFEWSVGSAPLATDVLGWTPVGAAVSVYNSTLEVPAGGTYYACVRAVGVNGLDALRCSDGVKVLDAATAGLRAVCVPPSSDETVVF